MRSTLAAGLFASALAFPLTGGAFSFDESVDGDSSGNQLAPASLVLSAGSNDLDFVAVPEPMTLVLFGAGLGGLALAGRRRSA